MNSSTRCARSLQGGSTSSPQVISTSTAQRIKTKDLWQSAFMLACGCDLVDLRLESRHDNRGKQEVFFTFSGTNADELSWLFKSGQATCHVGLLRASMIHLKEEMFKLINR